MKVTKWFSIASALVALLEHARWRLPDLRADQSSRLCWRWVTTPTTMSLLP